MKKLFLISFAVFCALAILPATAQNINQGLVAWYPFECTTSDTTANLNNLQPNGAPLCDTGKINSAYLLDGKKDYFTSIKTNTNIFSDSAGFTWSLWFKGKDLPKTTANKLSQTLISAMDTALTEDFILGFGDVSNEEKNLIFRVDGKGGIAGYMQPVAKHSPAGGWKNDEWYHVSAVCNYTAKKVYLYLNGQLVDSATTRGEHNIRNMNFAIGAAIPEKIAEGFFNGWLDEVRIYNRPITAQEANYLYRLKANQLGTDTKVLAFGNILCEKSKTLTLNLTNLGPGDFEISNTRFTNGKYFKALNGGKNQLIDGQVFPLSIEFTPSDTVDAVDTLIIENNSNVIPTYIYMTGSRDFKIARPTSVDFGDVYLCNTSNTFEKVITLTNTNSIEPLVITGYKNSNVLFNSYIKTQDTLFFNTPKNIKVFITPILAKLDTTILTIYFDSCHTSKSFTITASPQSVLLSAVDSINLGKVKLGAIASHTFSIYNIGTTDLDIVSITTLLNNFKINSKTSFNLKSQDSNYIELSINPKFKDNFDTISISYNSPCGIRTKLIPIFAYGTYEAEFTLSSRNVTKNTGDTISFPIYLNSNNPTSVQLSEFRNFKIDLSLNPTIFTPLASSASYTKDGDRNVYTLTFAIDSSNLNKVFYSPAFKINLGNAAADTIKLGNFQNLDGMTNATINSEVLTIGNICMAGGERLIEVNGNFYMNEIAPNPVSNKLKVEFELIETGISTLKLVSMTEGSEYQLQSANMNHGFHSLEFNINYFTSGNYYLILETPSQKLFKKIVINK